MSGRAKSSAGLEGEVVELEVVELLQGGPHDLALGQQPRVGEPEQAREQLPAGQVTGGAEQHDDVGVDEGRIGDDPVRWRTRSVSARVVMRPVPLPLPSIRGHGIGGMFPFRVRRESAV